MAQDEIGMAQDEMGMAQDEIGMAQDEIENRGRESKSSRMPQSTEGP